MSKRICLEVKEGKDKLLVSFVWNSKKYIIDKASMSSYYQEHGFKVTCTVEGMKGKHLLRLDGDNWYMEIKNPVVSQVFYNNHTY